MIANNVNCGAKDPLSWFLCQCIGNLLVHLDLFVSFAFVLIVVIHLLGDLLAWCCTTGMVPFYIGYHWYTSSNHWNSCNHGYTLISLPAALLGAPVSCDQ